MVSSVAGCSRGRLVLQKKSCSMTHARKLQRPTNAIPANDPPTDAVPVELHQFVIALATAVAADLERNPPKKAR
jgi:hypothetical protein